MQRLLPLLLTACLTCPHTCAYLPCPPCPTFICSTQEERLYWEQWLLDISILGGPAGASSAAAAFEEQDALAAGSLRAQRRQRVQAAIEECLKAIVRHGAPAAATGPSRARLLLLTSLCCAD